MVPRFTGTMTQIYYYDLETKHINTAYTVKYDEGGKYLALATTDSTAPWAFDLASTSSPFIKLKPFNLHIRCDHPIFGIMDRNCSLLVRAYISDMITISTGAGLGGWRCNYAGAYIVEVDDFPVFNTVDFLTTCEACLQYLTSCPHIVLHLTIAPERWEALQEDIVVPRLHLDQLRHVVRVLSEMREGRTVAMDEIPD
jgi:hypothetical protein